MKINPYPECKGTIFKDSLAEISVDICKGTLSAKCSYATPSRVPILRPTELSDSTATYLPQQSVPPFHQPNHEQYSSMGEVNPNISSHLHQESSFRDISQMVQQGDRDMDQVQYHPLQTANMTFQFMETVQQSAINRHVVDVSFYKQVKLDFQLNIIVHEDVFETLNSRLNSSTQMAVAFAQPIRGTVVAKVKINQS